MRLSSSSIRTAFLASILAVGASLASPTASAAQGAPAPVAGPAARPADVASPDAIIAALYDVISGAAGQKRDWDRFRSLFAPGARLIPTGGPAGQPARAVMLTPDEYVQRAGVGLERDGFFEREIGRVTERFGRVMHAFSAYDSKRRADDAQPFSRGINSIQLLDDGTRWWIVSVYWDSERPGNEIPAKYLNRGGR
jgi:hypothetical protein